LVDIFGGIRGDAEGIHGHLDFFTRRIETRTGHMLDGDCILGQFVSITHPKMTEATREFVNLLGVLHGGRESSRTRERGEGRRATRKVRVEWIGEDDRQNGKRRTNWQRDRGVYIAEGAPERYIVVKKSNTFGE
jgi:hypothetical protein